MSAQATVLAVAVTSSRTFTRLHAFAPRVNKLRVAGIAALLEPRTAASATRELARYFVRGTFGARRNRRRRYFGARSCR